MTKIVDLVPGPFDSITATITHMADPFTTNNGKLGQTIILADDTGQLKFTLWNDKDTTSPKGKTVSAQLYKYRVGDTLTILGGNLKEFDGNLEGSTGYSGRIILAPTP